MFSAKKTRRIYQSPCTKVAEIDLEGLVCLSDVQFSLQADELNNMNVTRNGVAHDGPGTEHYFEF